jgi:hypothetical protein
MPVRLALRMGRGIIEVLSSKNIVILSWHARCVSYIDLDG